MPAVFCNVIEGKEYVMDCNGFWGKVIAITEHDKVLTLFRDERGLKSMDREDLDDWDEESAIKRFSSHSGIDIDIVKKYCKGMFRSD
jgi:hypothetical protein